jgi:tetratricopeptide (TPR) repeat protein
VRFFFFFLMCAVFGFAGGGLLVAQDAQFFIQRAKEYTAQFNDDKALEHYDLALGAEPNNVRALNGRGGVFLKKKEYSKARMDFEKAYNIDSNDAETRHNLQYIYDFYRQHPDLMNAKAPEPEAEAAPFKEGDAVAPEGPGPAAQAPSPLPAEAPGAAGAAGLAAEPVREGGGGASPSDSPAPAASLYPGAAAPAPAVYPGAAAPAASLYPGAAAVTPPTVFYSDVPPPAAYPSGVYPPAAYVFTPQGAAPLAAVPQWWAAPQGARAQARVVRKSAYPEVELPKIRNEAALPPQSATPLPAQGAVPADLGSVRMAQDGAQAGARAVPQDAYQAAVALNNTGVQLNKLGDFEKAIEQFTSAISRYPHFAIAYNNRGAAYFYSGRYKEALADFNTALSLNPFYYDAQANREQVTITLASR